ncbi:UNVERIFIED_CONTAM: hypothetical protein HDU68_005619, partial [Siphonaria sp. JEL0065]
MGTYPTVELWSPNSNVDPLVLKYKSAIKAAITGSWLPSGSDSHPEPTPGVYSLAHGVAGLLKYRHEPLPKEYYIPVISMFHRDEETGKVCAIFFCHQDSSESNDSKDLHLKMVQGLFNSSLDVNETVYGVLLLGPEYVIYEFSLDYDCVERLLMFDSLSDNFSTSLVNTIESIPKRRKNYFR